MRLGTFAASLGGLLVCSALAVGFQVGQQARGQPLTGRWAAEFMLDSARSSYADTTWAPRALIAAGEIAFGNEVPPGTPSTVGWLALQAVYEGTHTVDFAPLLGKNGSLAPEAVGIRTGRSAVAVHLSGVCCHTGGTHARGQIVGDRIAGQWRTDSDGWTAWGYFTLRRQ